MTITPTGLPAWTRTAAHTDYGGHTSKTNYMGGGVINAKTDVGAEQVCRMAADVAALVRVAPFAVLTIQFNDTPAADPTILYANLMTGVTANYEGDNPPSGFPSASRAADGVCLLSFDSSYSDDYGVAADFAPEQAEGTGHGSSNVIVDVAISGTDLQVTCADEVGGSVTDPLVTVVVY